ncbi:hypothetical protein ALC62_12375, partial [Cyphomyrmex costatus]
RIVTGDEKWIYFDNLKHKRSWQGVVYYKLLKPKILARQRSTTKAVKKTLMQLEWLVDTHFRNYEDVRKWIDEWIASKYIFYADAGGGYDCNWLARLSALQSGCNRLGNRNPVFGGLMIIKVANLFLGHDLTVILVLTSRSEDQDIT